MRRFLAILTACSLTLGIPSVASAVTAADQGEKPRVVQAEKKTSVKTTAAALTKGLKTSPPLYVGYKGGSFLPVGARAKKDSRGCSLNRQLLISLATTKPKVGKKCKLTGGTWNVDFGTKTVKSAKGLSVIPIVDDKSAWGQGAYAWTPQQRDSWARNTGGGSTATRLQSTNQVLTAGYLKSLQQIASKAPATRSLGAVNKTGTSLLSPRIGPAIIIGSVTYIRIIGGAVAVSNNEIEPTGNASDAIDSRSVCNSINPLVAGFVANMAAWGLSIDPALQLELMSFYNACPTDKEFMVTFETAVAQASFTEQSSNTSQQVGLADPSGSTGANATIWKTYTDYAAPVGGVIPGDLFGMHVPDIGSQPRPAGSFPNIPVGYVRLWDSNTSWRSLEPNVNGTYEWTTLDLAVQRVRDSGAKVMMVLGYTPGWASASGTANAAPANFDDYSEYVRSVACRYGNAVSSYEVWNEGNLDTFWTGTPEQLADLTKRAYTEIKKCSNAEVIAASTGTRASGPFASNYLPYLQALGQLGWPIDGYSVHTYPTASGGASARLEGLKQFKAMLASAGAPVKPIYDTELNYGLAGLGEPHVDLNEQQSAAALIRSYVDSVRYGISSTFWFLWTTGYYDKLGIQLNPSATLNGVAYTQAWRWLVNSRFQRCGEFVTNEATGPVTACQFTFSNGQNHTILWTETGKEARVQGRGLGSQLCNAWGECMQIGNSVTVTDVPVWIGEPGGIYGPTATVDPTKDAIPTTIMGTCESLRGRPLWTFSCTDLGTVPVGSTKIQPIKVTNESRKVHTLTFRVSPGLTIDDTMISPSACNLNGQKLSYLQSCYVYVKWTPTTPGPFQGTITALSGPLQAYMAKLNGSAS